MKKTIKLGLTTTAFALILAIGACNKTPSKAETSEVKLASSPDKKTVVDLNGIPAEIPIHPQRLVTLSEIDLDVALALGIKPVASTDARGLQLFPRYLQTKIDQNGKLESLGSFGQPNLETLLMLKPDVIVAGPTLDAQVIQQLRQIAPTLVSAKPGEPWQDVLQRAAEWFDREEAEKAFLTEYKIAVANANKILAEQQNAEISIVRWTPQGPMYMLGDSFVSSVLKDIGLTRPASQQAAGLGHSPPISREKIAQLDGDFLVIGSYRDPKKELEELKKLPEFNQLNAVKNGRFAIVDSALWTGVGGPIAALTIVQTLPQWMIKDKLKPQS